jgi:hypothetical protein
MFNDPISDLNVTLMCVAIGCVPERKTMLSWSRSLGIVSLVLLFSANTAAKAKTPTISLAQARAKALALHPGEIKECGIGKDNVLIIPVNRTEHADNLDLVFANKLAEWFAARTSMILPSNISFV